MTSWSLTAWEIAGRLLFCISGHGQHLHFPLLALAFSQMFNLLCERADNVHGADEVPHHVRGTVDEAATGTET